MANIKRELNERVKSVKRVAYEERPFYRNLYVRSDSTWAVLLEESTYRPYRRFYSIAAILTTSQSALMSIMSYIGRSPV